MRIILKLVGILSLLAILATGRVSGQTTTAVYYSFNGISGNGSTVADFGATRSVFSNLNTTGGGGVSFPTGTGLNSLPGFNPANPNNRAVQQSGWVGDASWFQFTFNATGLQGLTITYAGESGHAQGPTSFLFEYSTNGVAGTFFSFATNSLLVNTYRLFTNDLSAVTGLDNNSNIVFRLGGLGAINSGKTADIDNFTVIAVPIAIPEPSSFLLIGMGMTFLLLIHRGRR